MCVCVCVFVDVVYYSFDQNGNKNALTHNKKHTKRAPPCRSVCVCVCLAFLSFLALYMQYVCGVRSSSFTNIRNKIIMHKQRAKQRLYLRGYQHKQAGTHRHSRLCTNIDSSVISIGHHHHHTHTKLKPKERSEQATVGKNFAL